MKQRTRNGVAGRVGGALALLALAVPTTATARPTAAEDLFTQSGSATETVTHRVPDHMAPPLNVSLAGGDEVGTPSANVATPVAAVPQVAAASSDTNFQWMDALVGAAIVGSVVLVGALG